MTTYVLKPGLESNPLRKHRNIPCPCQSGAKAKRCCGRYHALPTATAEKLRQYLKAREFFQGRK